MTSDNQNKTINILKGFAILLVVYGHVLQRVMVLRGENFYNHPVFKIIYTFHMPAFFLISGYLIALSLGRRPVVDVFKARCKGLLLPYLTWGTLGVLTLYVLNLKEGTGSSCFLSDWVNQMFINPQVWFLWSLFFCSMILVLSVKLQKFCGVLIFPVIYAVMLLITNKATGGLYYIIWFYPFYAAGYLINMYGSSLTRNLNHAAVFVVSLLAFVFLSRYWTNSDYIYVHKMNMLSSFWVENILQFTFLYLIGFLGIGIAVFVCAFLARTPTARLWETLGFYSLDIYLIQRYVVEGIFPRLLLQAGLKPDAHSFVFLAVIAPLIVIIAVSLCLLFSKYFIRKIPLLNTFLLGGRS